ncbi:hypothetical protein FSP39_021162 [Pinctada imbricata]|uniref:DEAD/DEAH-box helicase domain-containing protein n=1 Tax=Pinctada imbricata TaxID=66713 RepID=A0AA88YL25_PINIB|nr:hypothetical protein FSP39_021162 [Pinctada imbricata]
MKKFKEIKDLYGFNFNLKQGQLRLIEAILNNSDAVGVFPTGYGKSLCYTLPPVMRKHAGTDRCISLVISPLKSIMFDQCRDLNSRSIPAVCVKSRSEMASDDIDERRGAPRGLACLSHIKTPKHRVDMHSNIRKRDKEHQTTKTTPKTTRRKDNRWISASSE